MQSSINKNGLVHSIFVKQNQKKYYKIKYKLKKLYRYIKQLEQTGIFFEFNQFKTTNGYGSSRRYGS